MPAGEIASPSPLQMPLTAEFQPARSDHKRVSTSTRTRKTPAVTALTPQERRRIHCDREYISDNQARVIAVALRLDIFIFDAPHRCVKYVEYAQGVVSYPEHDACAGMLLGRQGDDLLTPHYMNH